MAAKEKKKKWYKKLRNKYRLVLFNDRTFEERFTFRLTRLNVIVAFISLTIVLIAITFIIIAYTPLKTYVPGYPDVDQRKQLYYLNILADSLMNDIQQKNRYIDNIKRIVNNEEIIETQDSTWSDSLAYDTIQYRVSSNDSLFRLEFENMTKYNLYSNYRQPLVSQKTADIQNLNFFKPLEGVITLHFNPNAHHYGIDIATSHNEAVKSVLDGTVILADWTLETGNVLVIAHDHNFISVYKHNATLLKQEGDLVKAGEPVAIAGQSGELTTGPHLHFELWLNRKPVNPQEYIFFN